MDLNIEKEVAALRRMTVNELRGKYTTVFGENTNARHKEWLVRRITGACRRWPRGISRNVPANGPRNWPMMPIFAPRPQRRPSQLQARRTAPKRQQ